MKKFVMSATALLMTVPTFAQTVFGSGLDTMKSEAEYWVKGGIVIAFLIAGGHAIMTYFVGDNANYVKGFTRIGIYVVAAIALWAGYDYMQTVR